EDELLLAGEAPFAAALDELALGEVREPVDERARLRAAEERREPTAPEDLAEDARRAKDAPHLGIERLEARLHHREDRLGERVALAVGHCADQLLEIERVPRGALDEHRHARGRHVRPEHLADELLARALRELRELDLRHRTAAPEAGEDLHDLRPR